MASLGDDGLDVLLAHEVLDRGHESRPGRADHAVRRPGRAEVGVVGDVLGRVLVEVARGHHELVLVPEVAHVTRDHRCDLHATFDAEAAALDEVLLDVDHEKPVSHALIG